MYLFEGSLWKQFLFPITKPFKPVILRHLFLFFLLSIATTLASQTWESNKAKPGPGGCLTYEEDANQNRIPDFSHAGYKGGGVALPDVPVKITIGPLSGDNTSHIQDAIDAVSNLVPDSTGFRGTVLLAPGTYPVSGQLYIHTSGVVLRGSGDGRDTETPTIIYGTGNIPAQRDLIIMGGNDNSKWESRVPNTTQDITTEFVQVGSRSFEVADASLYEEGDNIIIYHPCTIPWLEAIDYGGTGDDPGWRENQYPIMYNRFITGIEGNTITIDAPVYNHLDRSLSQSYIYTYDREGLVTQVGIENLRVDIESLGGEDEDHIWDAINIMQAEDAWVRNVTVSGFGLSGVRVGTATRVSIVNVHSIDPVAEVRGGRMYNFHVSKWSNNILIDNCYARGGRHHYVTNGTGTISGIVVLRSRSENPYSTSEGHRQWSTGILFDNLIDYGTAPDNGKVMGFYNRGSGGTAHGWGAAHSVLWNCSTARPGMDAGIIVEQPPTAQNYAIGCKGKVGVPGNFNKPTGYIEGSNRDEQLVPVSLYEAQLLCRKSTVISDFKASKATIALEEPVLFSPEGQGDVNEYRWEFGEGARPVSATGPGPHTVRYLSEGKKTIRLSVSNNMSTHTEVKTAYLQVKKDVLFAVDDFSALRENDSVRVNILDNDSYPAASENLALVLNGTDEKVIYDDSRLLDEYPFTMMAWIRTDSEQAQTMLYLGKPASNFTGNSLSMENGIVRLEAWNYDGSSIKQNITTTAPINDGEWHHVAGVFESPESRHLYIDGVLAGTDTAEMNNIVENLYRFSAGNREDRTPNGWWDGVLDEVRLYAAALEMEDIQNIMQGWDCSEEEKLLYWNFDSANDTLVTDGFHYFDGVMFGGSLEPNETRFGPLSATITRGPTHGTARFSDAFEITYRPEAGFFGQDSLQYELRLGECQVNEATIRFQVDEIVGIGVLSEGSPLLYPNPTDGLLQLEVEEAIQSLRLFTMGGTLIKESQYRDFLDLGDVESGTYVLEIKTKSGKLLWKKVVRL